MNTHLKTAHEYGVKKALETCGYASIEDLQKRKLRRSVCSTDSMPAKTASDNKLDGLFATLKAKLG